MRVAFLSFAFLAMGSLGSAQYLRVSANAFVSDPAGNSFDSNEQNWVVSGAGTMLTESASALTANTNSTSDFSAKFGQLKGNVAVSTIHSGAGTSQAHAKGTFFPFTDGVGASFNDSFTLVGAGLVAFRVTYTLHSILSELGAGSTAESALDVYAYPTSGPILTGSPIWHTAVGANTTTRSFDGTAPGGSVYGLQADLYAFAALNTSTDGAFSASADASHTASISIEVLSGGSFTTASGHDYAPVPEPASLSVIALGLLALRRRKASQ